MKDDNSKELKKKKKKRESKPEQTSIKSINYWKEEPEISNFSLNSIKSETRTKRRKNKNKKKNKKKNIIEPPKVIEEIYRNYYELSKYEQKSSSEDKILKDLQWFISQESERELYSCINEVLNRLKEISKNLEKPREITKTRLENLVKKTFNSNEIYLKEYGSYATKLLTPFSDIDLSVQQFHVLTVNSAREMLKILNNNLGLCPYVIKSQPILSAIVPVIKVKIDPSKSFEQEEIFDKSLEIKVDIIVDLNDDMNISS